MKRNVVNRLIRQAMSRRVRLIRRAKERLLASVAVGSAASVARRSEGLERVL